MALVGNITTIIAVVVLVVALYYLYQYLYGDAVPAIATIVNGPQSAIRMIGKATIVPSTNLPPLYEGGEYSVSLWMYINDYKYRRDLNKHVLSLGGISSTGFDTLRVYLGAFKNTLSVRVHSKSVDGGTQSGPPGPATDALPLSSFARDFNVSPQGVDTGYFPTCDLVEVELQRWINITVVLSGRSVDVYMDGKLARSCVLPSFFKVDPSGYQLTLLDKTGFGGFISNVNAYGYAMNPEQVYRNFMVGPNYQYSLLGWLKSLLDPKASSSLEYPKMN
jgi:hypothetical protein